MHTPTDAFFKTIVALFLLSVSALSLAVGDPELRGKTKSSIESQFGRPDSVIGPVGEPPITKWQYKDITVVFEYDHVVHAYRRNLELEKQAKSAMAGRPQTRSNAGDTIEIPQ